jgi:outer membrane lipoprotein-sorting protein
VAISASLRRHRALRWGIPVAAAGVVALVASGVLTAQASPDLPSRTAAQLLADIESARVDQLSGTIVEKAALGLPELPSLGGGSRTTTALSLLSGTHSVRVWFSGPQRQRLALLEPTSESDIFHNGADLWQWDSDTRTATHTTLPPDAQSGPPAPEVTKTLTPQQLAEDALRAVEPTTVVHTDSQRKVADQAAYELVLEPRDATSRIGSVRIAVDGKRKIPLGVQVFARGDDSTPALDVSFTSISYSAPHARFFVFTPPHGATVKQQQMQRAVPQSPSSPGVLSAPQIFGHGWTSVALLRTSPSTFGSSAQRDTGAVLGSLPRVSGSWGAGRLFSSKLLSVLFLDDGRVYVGAVDPPVLYATATAHR